MAQTSSVPARGRALFVGGLLLAGLFGLIQLAPAQNSTKEIKDKEGFKKLPPLNSERRKLALERSWH